jgi:hypothetical protein
MGSRLIMLAGYRSARSKCIPERGRHVSECGAAMHRAVADGWLEMHASGAYVKLTQKGADRFAQ